MAEETKNDRLNQLAFELYKSRAGAHASQAKALAIDCFRKAAAFMDVEAEITAEGFDNVAATQPGAECRAPNLHETHPLNLVARNGGDLGRVAKIKAFLDKNTTPRPTGDLDRDTHDVNELTSKVNKAFPGLNWDAEQIETARQIFPAYCNN